MIFFGVEWVFETERSIKIHLWYNIKYNKIDEDHFDLLSTVK